MTTVTMKAPVVIAQSGDADISLVGVPRVNATDWGRFRMPKIYRLPSGDIGLTFSISHDHYSDQGRLSPFFTSADNGATWVEAPWPDLAGADTRFKGMGTFIAELHDGDFLAIPATNGLELPKESFPASVGTVGGFGAPFLLHDIAAAFSREHREWFAEFNGMRWSAAAKNWSPVKIPWGDHKGQLAFSYLDTPQKYETAWTQKFYFEQPVVRGDGELYVADYWSVYRNADGSVFRSWPSTLMVSKDNGRTWERRAFIAGDAAASGIGQVHYVEPALARNLRGELVSVIRDGCGSTMNGVPKPMILTHSKDNGHTWSKPTQLSGLHASQGVFPQLLQLGNGVMVLVYGRASRGIWLSCSRDGGHAWDAPVNIATDVTNGNSCGYTGMVAINESTFLLAYADVNLKNKAGENCKSIVVREITVKSR